MIEFTVLRTKLRVSPFFFSVLTLFLIINKNGIAGAAVLFSALHELGHFLALLCTKTYPKLIEIKVFGVHITLPENLSTAEKCLVLAAGFSVNFILSVLLFYFEKTVFAVINIFIGIFTALPLASTDGGEVLKSILEEFFPQKAEKIFGMVSLSFLFVVSVLFIFASALTKNYFILIAIIYMVICAINTAA